MKQLGAYHKIGIWFILLALSGGCTKENQVDNNDHTVPTDTSFKPTPYILAIPFQWSTPPIPADNPLTEEGVALGRRLFYDSILSANHMQACASCHDQRYGFTDFGKRYSTGIDGIPGTRQAMPIFNLAWVERFAPILGSRPYRFFWDGGATDLESQVIGPITNPIEMHDSLVHVVAKLQAHPEYPTLFKKAFGTSTITSQMLMKAIAQFERTIISSESRFDQYLIHVKPNGIKYFDTTVFNEQENRGLRVFMDSAGGDCFHCHSMNSPFTTDFLFHNNGHNNQDEGLKRITGNNDDKGKFRTATLRNLLLTAPYMHDGRFNTLEEVVEFYNSGASRVWPADPFITKHPNGLNLNTQQKADLVAFLKALTDSAFLSKVAYSAP